MIVGGDSTLTTSKPETEDTEANWMPILDNYFVLHKPINNTKLKEEEDEWWADQKWFEASIYEKNFTWEYDTVSKYYPYSHSACVM